MASDQDMSSSWDVELGLVTYCLLGLVQPVVNGTPRRDASRRAWHQLGHSRFLVRHGVVLPVDEEHSTRCVAAACSLLLYNAARLARPHPLRVPLREVMAVPVGVPEDCLVSVDLIRRLMLGEQPGDALRNAIDSQAGRERRHRVPLSDADVLTFTSELRSKLKRSLASVRAL